MSDEEIVREALNLIPAVDYRSEDEDAMHDGLAALSRILSERDSLRTERNEAVEYNTGLRDRVAQLEEALERIADGSTGLPYSRIARQALTSSEKESDPGPIATAPLMKKLDVDSFRPQSPEGEGE